MLMLTSCTIRVDPDSGSILNTLCRIKRAMRSYRSFLALCAAAMLLISVGHTQEQPGPEDDCQEQADDTCVTPLKRALQTLGTYATSPLRWKGQEWLEFGGVVGAI